MSQAKHKCYRKDTLKSHLNFDALKDKPHFLSTSEDKVFSIICVMWSYTVSIEVKHDIQLCPTQEFVILFNPHLCTPLCISSQKEILFCFLKKRCKGSSIY